MKEHFKRVEQGEIRVSLKPQAVYKLPEVWKKDVRSLLGEGRRDAHDGGDGQGARPRRRRWARRSRT